MVSKSASELGCELPWQSVFSDQLDFAAGGVWLKAGHCKLIKCENIRPNFITPSNRVIE